MLKKIKKMGDTYISGIKNMFLKPISMLLSFIYTPMLLSYLGDEKYGLWITILSIINWVNYFDIGIGNGLRNILTKEFAKKDYISARKSISTAYVILTIISIIVLIVLIIISISLNWHLIFSTEVDLKITMLISFIFICINFVLALSNIILYALQMSEHVAFRGCLVQGINIIGLIFLKNFTIKKMEYVAILFGLSTMIIYIYNTVSIFKKRTELIPNIKLFEKEKVREVTNIGLKFFVIQLMALLLFTVDDLIITHYFGAVYVTPFSLVNKIFNTVFSLFAAFVVPFWSRSTIAFEQKDRDWLKRCIKQVFMVCILFIFTYILLMFNTRSLIEFWMRRSISIEKGLPEIMCLFYSIYTIMSAECQFINGSGKINIQLLVYCIIGILNIPFSIFLGVYLEMGVVGVRLATVILVIFEIIILGINLKKIIKNI